MTIRRQHTKYDLALGLTIRSMIAHSGYLLITSSTTRVDPSNSSPGKTPSVPGYYIGHDIGCVRVKLFGAFGIAGWRASARNLANWLHRRRVVRYAAESGGHQLICWIVVISDPMTSTAFTGRPALYLLIPLIGLIGTPALAAYILASSYLNLSLFGLLGYVEPVLLVIVTMLLGERTARRPAAHLHPHLARRRPAGRRG